MKAFAQRLIERAGYRVYRERPRDLANPLPVELAAHRAVLRAVLEEQAVTTVLDVGAHTGGYGALLREIGYTRRDRVLRAGRRFVRGVGGATRPALARARASRSAASRGRCS